jgi:phosphatidylethanolamine/phosphatidyl-N-methylethanolamine N-methyltransferase
MHSDAVKAAYRRYANVYDVLFGPILKRGRRAAIEALYCRPGDRVLEVGVGTGLSLPLYPPYVRVTGIDLSREMLDKARVRAAREKLYNIEGLHEMDAEAMSFADASFDKIVAMYVVSVVEKPAQLLRELHRVCSPHGEIVIVNHMRSANPLLGAVEKGLARFSHTLGFHPDFQLSDLVNGSSRIESVSNVQVLWKVMRLRNGVHAPRGPSATGTAPRRATVSGGTPGNGAMDARQNSSSSP